MSEWTERPEQAHYDARHHPHDRRTLPHYMRCEFYRNGLRCKLPEGHGGEHAALEEKKS